METDPVSQEHFFGRQEILSTLKKRFDAFLKGYRHNVALIGNAFTGKSSVLTQFLRQYLSDEAIAILIRLDEADSFRSFSQKWIGGILHGYQRFRKLPAALSPQDLINQTRRSLPVLFKKVRAIKKLVDARQYQESYRAILSLPYVLQQETGKKILLVIDEFDRLENFALKDPFEALGKEIMLQKDTMYIVSSSNKLRSQDIFKNKLSLLFSNFELTEVGNFSFEESENWIRSRVKNLLQDPSLCRVLIYITNGHPYYLDVILSRLEILSAAGNGKEIGLDALIRALKSELFFDRGTLHQHFFMKLSFLSKNRPSTSSDVLLAIALGKKKIISIAGFLNKSSEEVKKILQRLIQDGIVQKSGSFFDISDLLFRFWLAEVYYRKRASLGFDYSADRLNCRKSLSSFIELIIQEDKKDLTLRIEELFKRFRNEVVELEAAKVKCPRFTEVIAKPSNGRMFPVLAKNQNTSWLCQVVKERLEEEDVHLFLNDAGQLDDAVHKRLMIVLQGTDLNAKLLAQEAKVQLWNLNDLNLLLDLYGNPKVIL